jgi:hypothetical protein
MHATLAIDGGPAAIPAGPPTWPVLREPAETITLVAAAIHKVAGGLRGKPV